MPQTEPSGQKKHWRGFSLYPFQRDAIAAMDSGHSVLVSAPTGAGKTVIAEHAIEREVNSGRRVVYTSPIKALSNQKYRDFKERYGDRVGIMTGDVTLGGDCPVLVMTTEIFRNTLLDDPKRLEDVAWVIMDEVHYLGDVDRGTVWEESLIFAPKDTRFVGLSATIPNLEEVRAWIEATREEEVKVISTDERPVPLSHQIWVPRVGPARVGQFKKAVAESMKRSESDRQDRRGGGGHRGHRGRPDRNDRRRPDRHAEAKEQDAILNYLEDEDLYSCLFFCFSRKECEARARRTMRRRLLSRKEHEVLTDSFESLVERYECEEGPILEDLRELNSRGILYHHAGMLPIHKEIVERQFTTGLVKLLFTTETFALGVNMPARTVVFSSLRKYDGIAMRYLETLSYYQMAGRAGRQGLDKEGTVFSVVNTAEDSQSDVKGVIFGKVAPVKSQFNLSYSAVLNLKRNLGDDLFSAVDRSFAAWQSKGDPKASRRLLQARLRILEKHGYLNAKGLTGKGRVAARINGYEIQIAELYWAGLFEDMGPVNLACMFAAMVYEARRADPSAASALGGLGPASKRAKNLVAAFGRTENSFGIESTIKALDFGLTAAVRHWADGMPFLNLERNAPVQGGDFVRVLRMTVQMLRQFGESIKGDRAMAEIVSAALDAIDRDEVDAERQLRLG